LVSIKRFAALIALPSAPNDSAACDFWAEDNDFVVPNQRNLTLQDAKSALTRFAELLRD
jgi:hypothetical protein